MSKQGRKSAEKLINDAISNLYPDLKVRPNTGNYILNQLLKGGFTSDKITVHFDEIKDELDQAVFKCKTDAEDFANLIPQPIVLSNKDFDILAKALANPPKANEKLMKAMGLKDDEAMLIAGPSAEQRVLITNIRPIIHLVSAGTSEHSPCGNEDDQAPVTHHEFEVTCHGCKEAIRKRKL